MSFDLSETCPACRRLPKNPVSCGLCEVALCKSCALFLDAEALPFLAERPAALAHSYYCPSCHQVEIEPIIESYERTLAEAKEVFFFFEGRKLQVPTQKKALVDVKVENCVDRDETILRIGFMAAKQGFNAVIDAVVESHKVRHEGYQRAMWTGRGRPAQVDAEKLARRTGTYGKAGLREVSFES